MLVRNSLNSLLMMLKPISNNFIKIRIPSVFTKKQGDIIRYKGRLPLNGPFSSKIQLQ
jgi:hypothetical protein